MSCDLVHGAAIIKSFSIPIGLLSEESQEARNKEVKQRREFNTRKDKPMNTNEDIIHFLLVSSDSFISSLRQKTITMERNFLLEA